MQKYLPALLLILLGVSARLLPHPANFAPIAAIGLFSGMYLPKKYALIIPGLALIASDFVLGSYLWQVMVAVYICFGMSGLIGMKLGAYFTRLNTSKLSKFNALVGSTLLGSIIFFLVTNWAVWAFGTMYPHTASGLMQSYTMALPFFKNTLLGDIFYTGMLVGVMELIRSTSKRSVLKKLEVGG